MNRTGGAVRRSTLLSSLGSCTSQPMILSDELDHLSLNKGLFAHYNVVEKKSGKTPDQLRPETKTTVALRYGAQAK